MERRASGVRAGCVHRFQRVHTRIDAVAQRTPDRTAVICGDEALTYGQLTIRARSFGLRLRGLGIGPDEPVAILMERSLDLVVGILGILHAGAAYLPLDASFPRQRSADLVRRAGARFVVTDTNEPLPPLIAVPVRNDRTGDTPPAADGPSEAVREGRRAYIIATSGSTGAPKAIVTTHRNVAWYVDAFAGAIEMTSDDVVLARTSPSFDPHVVEILLPLAIGARIVMVPGPASADPAHLLDEIGRHRVTVVQATPSLWQALAARPWPFSWEVKALCGGEAMTETLKDDILRAGHVRLWNVYGPTETTVWCSALEMRSTSPVGIGGAIPGLRFAVRAKNGGLVPVDGCGELHISGPGLAEGYLEDPALTAERFVDDPDSDDPDARWYRTGDLVRPRVDGSFGFAGRADRQVKFRGHRVELEEVELAVCSEDDVVDARVLVDHADLVACIRRAPSAVADDILTERIGAALRKRLPPHMVPTRMVVVDVFPLTPTEKVDAQRLLEMSRPEARDRLPPDIDDPIVRQVTELWGEVLGRVDVLPGDRFSDLGGHSLNVVTMQLRILERFGVDISCSVITAHQTPVELAPLVTSASERTDSPPAAPGWLPLLPAQARYFEETPPDDVDRNVLHLLLRTRHDRTRVHRALEQILERHDAFRIDTIEAPPSARQHVGRRPLRRAVDLTETHSTLSAFLEAGARDETSMDVARGQLYACTMLASDGWVHVHLAMHHLLGDDVSLDIFKRELDHLLRDPAARLPPTATWSAWIEAHQSERARAKRMDELPTWRALVEPSTPSFVGDHPPTGDDHLASRTFTVSREALPLDRFDVRTRHGLLLSAAIFALGSTFELGIVGCRIVEGGRMLVPGLEDASTMGWLSHHHPLLVPVGASAAETLRSLEEALAAIEDRGASYGWLRYRDACPDLVDGRQLGDQPLYFNYLPELVATPDLEDVSFQMPSPVLSHQRITGLALVARDGDDGVTVSVHHNLDTIGALSCDRFCAAFTAGAGALVETT